MARNAKILMLQGKFSDCVPVARAAIDAARRANEIEAASIALNSLGVSLIQIGDTDEGRERLREAIRQADTSGTRRPPT